MSKLSVEELTKSLQRVDETLALLIKVNDEITPSLKEEAGRLKKEIEEIIKAVKNGFNLEMLEKQAKIAINEALRTCNIWYLEGEATKSAEILKKELIEVKKTLKECDEREKEYRIWFICAPLVLLAFILGMFTMWSMTYKRINKYQADIDAYRKAIGNAEIIRNFINSSCKVKKLYARYIHWNKEINCEREYFINP